jgi:transposase
MMVERRFLESKDILLLIPKVFLMQFTYNQTANITDREGALEAFKGASSSLYNVVNVLADGGYTGEVFATKVKEIIGADVEIAKRSELHTFEVIPKRWVVERSFAWLEKCRRLCSRCERKLETSLQMVNLAFLSLFLKRY